MISAEPAHAPTPLAPERTLLQYLEELPIGKPDAVTSKGLANYYLGGDIHIQNGDRYAPINAAPKTVKCKMIGKAAKELTLLLQEPPEGVVAEEEDGRHYKVRFTRLEGGVGP